MTLGKRIADKLITVCKFVISALHGFVFKPYVISKRISGESFKFLIGDPLGKQWYHTNNDTWNEMAFIRDRMIEPGDVVLECGGHHGCSAILLSRWVGETGKVVTFEPIKLNTEIIEKNLELNGLCNISVECRAVGAEPGIIRVSRSSCASIITNKIVGRQVEVINLDAFLHLKPTLVKIDVEGFEIQVLRGAHAILDSHPKLAIEIHAEMLHDYGTSVQELFSMIDLDVYDCWVQWSDDEYPVPYDRNRIITERVHFFALPKSAAQPA
jgi:FkbM family methyltransferase